ncbi:ATP-grasp domain-containing protein [Pseudonocardia endophytica]|uniref:Carbamoyl-phosphate synthase L subunit-like protein n=1 Tax=Pseudonocardia endophytica TaxID=401976 RepID=A0A4R1HTE0_PSEEN|nr:biotin carboxylase [Pseudonocardia endophytica]TCK24641.1 carbamoyl-phosphate synthase L subunit-like protein [Pseudonocardia endophytica]
MSEPADVFVLGLDDHNREILEQLPDAGRRYRFHPLLTIEELQYRDEIPLAELLDQARRGLDAFDGTVAAVIGFWDFPVSTMVPLLCKHVQRNCASLEAVVKCEHKYWSRLEQSSVTEDYPAFGLVDPDNDTEPPDGVGFPMWVKPVKSFSSALAFGVDDVDGFRDALTHIRGGIGFVGEPFEVVLDELDLPDEIAALGGRACLAEETATGRQVTLEGYARGEDVHVFGVVDTINRDDVASQDRFRYPSTLPDAVAERMADIARRIVRRVGLDSTTFNIEFFWDPEADRIRVLEVNPRHSQSHAELFADVDGVANHYAMVELALGHDPSMPSRQGRYATASKWFLRHLSDGVVRRVPTADEIAEVEREVGGTTIDVIVTEGDRLSELPDQDSYSYKIANVYVGGADDSEVRKRFERCAELLHFEFDS